MSDKFCYHSFNPEEHDGKTWMVCAKCGLRNPIGLFQTVDYTRHKAAQEYLNANTSWDNWYDPPLRSDSLNPHDHTDVIQYIQRRYGPKRSPIVKVRRKWVWIIFRTWEWECQICYISDHQSTWRKAYAQADRHARTHHRSQS